MPAVVGTSVGAAGRTVMKDLAAMRRRAIDLMREAIALLDEAGEKFSALHLQAAIDAAERILPMRPGDLLPDDRPDAPAAESLTVDPAFVRAIGGALALVATLLARQGSVSVREFSNLLGIYALAVKEKSADEGLIIACWVAIIRDIAEAQGDDET